MNAAKNQPSILTLRLGQSDQAGQGHRLLHGQRRQETAQKILESKPTPSYAEPRNQAQNSLVLLHSLLHDWDLQKDRELVAPLSTYDSAPV